MAVKLKNIIKALSMKFGEDITCRTSKYLQPDPKRSVRKNEFIESAEKLQIKRGVPFYNPYLHKGFSSAPPVFDRQPARYKLSGTDYLVEADDLHFVNNPAIQQMWDDIRRTVIINMDLPLSVIEKRIGGKEITPEVICNYMEILNHAMPGAALIQVPMAETNPGLVDDCNVRMITGDDDLADEIDDELRIDINKLFPAEQAEELKAAIGPTTWLAVHIPTIVVRACDGATAARWSAMQLNMTLIDTFRLGAGESAVGELTFAIKHVAMLKMSQMLEIPARRSRGPSNPGGLTFGFLADIVQTSRNSPPVKVSMNVVAAGAALYDQIWLGGYMSGGVGFTQYAAAVYTDDILDDFCYYGADYVMDKYKSLANKDNATLEVAKDIADEITLFGMEQYESFPTLLEDHFGGSMRASALGAASGITSALATGNSQIGLASFHLSMLIQKEGWGRLGSYGYDLPDQCGPCNVFSYLSDEGNPLELRGPNYPNYAMNVGHLGGYAGIVSSAHAACGDAFAINPLVKVAFANSALVFNWVDTRKCIALGAKRAFRAAGERSLVMSE